MKLVVETDIGNDPDDFFALCYFIAQGIDLKAILVSPGDKSQVAIVKFILKHLNREHVPVGVGRLDRDKTEVSGVHRDILRRYGAQERAEHDGLGANLLASVMDSDSDTELFVCGPLMSTGKYLMDGGDKLWKATMQGGYIGHHIWDPEFKSITPVVERFRGKDTVPTFNLNGDVKGAKAFLEADMWRRFVGKNVCHGVIYNADIHKRVCSSSSLGTATDLFREGMSMYLERHPEKKFHDPTAAALHLFPEIGTWVNGNLYRSKGEWGAKRNEFGDAICVGVDHQKLWDKFTWQGSTVSMRNFKQQQEEHNKGETK